MPQALMNRHHPARRSQSSVAAKVEPGHPMPQGPLEGVFSTSPQLQPTPPSQTSSPTSASTGFVTQGVMTPPAADPLAQQRQQQLLKAHNSLRPGLASTSSSGGSTARAPPAPLMPGTSGPGSSGSSMPSAYYPSPFQNHIDQLGKLTQQEYDAQADMIDDQDQSDHSTGPGPYPQGYPPPPGAPHGVTPHSHPVEHQHQHHPQNHSVPTSADGGGHAYGAVNDLFGNSEARPDEDPFGLWQSMTFPTQFSFPPSSMR
ncbi:MAG: hypothetical protein M4579_005337 [Chaenotheca gracillima]|nr:MAG: hypothetical protein M4579_005337 [Chaenotheca gracillima]